MEHLIWAASLHEDFMTTVITYSTLYYIYNGKMIYIFTECKMSPHYPKPKEVKGLAVEFSTNYPHIRISWKAIDHSQTGNET